MNTGRIAWFVSPHGFGHAARSATVMEAVRGLDPGIRFEIFTTVPEWFFRESLGECFSYYEVRTDVGLVQENPFREDLAKTIEALEGFYPLDNVLVERLAGEVRESGCSLVVCDIAPLGLAVAKAAGVPSVLIENFTWDWIYRGYLEVEGCFEKYASLIESIVGTADHHVQTEPLCRPVAADLTVGPIGRRARREAAAVREALGIGKDEKAVLLTLGGTEADFSRIGEVLRDVRCRVIVPGAGERLEHHGPLVLLPHHSGFYHPDLIAAADAVVGKSGYSTLAEVYLAGVPFGCVTRGLFREAKVLADFVEERMEGIIISDTDFLAGRWPEVVPALLGLPHVERRESDSAGEVAGFILEKVSPT